MTKEYLLIFILFLISVTSLSTFSLELTELNEQQCNEGNGTWNIPELATGDDPIKTKKNLTPYCICEKGYYWHADSNSCLNDSELRCQQTGGEWSNNSCQCPEGTIKWTEGFGCDTPGPEPKQKEMPINQNFSSYNKLLVSALIFLMILISYIKFVRKRRTKNHDKPK